MKWHVLALAALLAATIGGPALLAQEPAPKAQEPATKAQEPAPPAREPSSQAQEPAPSANEKLDIAYRDGDDERTKLDLFLPDSPADGPRPAVVFLHGGGWRAGDKKHIRFAAKEMAKAGYVGVSVGYRLAPKHTFPAQIEDVKSAIRFLRANADQWRIDKDRIAVAGASAGGHLALLAGLTLPKDNLEGGTNDLDQSSQVCAVVNIFGPTDLARREWLDLVEKMLEDFLGGSRDAMPQAYIAASPVTYIHKGGPPVLTVHGTKDPLVPYDQATLLDQALKAAGESSQLVTIEGKGHGDWTQEEWSGVMDKIKAFLADAFAKQRAEK